MEAGIALRECQGSRSVIKLQILLESSAMWKGELGPTRGAVSPNPVAGRGHGDGDVLGKFYG